MDADVLDRILRSQAQLITRQQALGAGLTSTTMRTELRREAWRMVYPGQHGVYVVGWGQAPLTDLQRIWAAVLAVSGDAVVSHESAVWLARRRGPAPVPVHLAVHNGRRVAPISGVRVHTLPDVSSPEVIDPRLRPPRMRPEVAAVDAAHLRRSTREAADTIYDVLGNRSVEVAAVAAALGRRKRHRHRDMLNAVLVDAGAGARSGMEREYSAIMRRHDLPQGVCQAKVAGPIGARWLDCLVTKGLVSPLVTELDGRLGHDLAAELWRDMDRDNLDEESGRGHLRYGPAQVFGEGCRVAGQVRRALVRRGWVDEARQCGPGCVALATR